ncbi:hypothetical protein A9Q99_11015 [Gammaproteobacteria bacterium 45_16_T64]|nr:hypothetical protein A9Q99_11015 [Gammaproteobacteria bacterium 45_16_T64]
MHRAARYTTTLLLFVISLALPLTSSAAPASKLLPFWEPHNETNQTTIDHSLWQNVLGKRLIDDHKSGVNRFDYAKMDSNDKSELTRYIGELEALDPRKYSRTEQKAYWINLYNALTVNLIVKNYPVKTITDLGKGFFSFGPWDDAITTIQGQSLTLNNIEHGILRPIYNDNRIHYAVNCASFGCPNLSGTAFTADNTEFLLNNAAQYYVNHQRGVRFENNQLVVSSIYHWYKVDFGTTDAALLQHLIAYSKPALAQRLAMYTGDIDNEYNWSLNQP